MARPDWRNKLSNVLKHETVVIEKYSEKTNNNYNADAIPILRVLSVGSIEDLGDGNWRYAIVDSEVGLEYEIKVSKKIEVRFGLTLEFMNVVGGETTRGGWYNADDVRMIPPKQNA